MSMTLRATRGISQILLGSTVQTLLRFGVIGILARHLTPADFGVVAAAMIIVSIVDLEGALGVAPALIQRKELEPRHIETGQSLALAVAALLGGSLYLASDFVADLLSIPQSASALHVLCLVVFLRTAVSVPEAMIYRTLQFRKLAATQVASYCIGYAIVGVGLAMMSFGYWSLVYAEVAQALALSLLYVWQSRPSPRLGFDRLTARELLGFGLSLSAAKVMRQVIFSIDQAVVARLFGPTQLGLYVRAQSTTFRPINALGGALESVIFPMMSTIQHDTERVNTVFARGMSAYFAFISPVVATSAILSNEIIYILLGSGWTEAALLMQLLAAGFFCRTANRLCATILKARGRALWLLLLQIEHVVIVSTCILAGAQFGVRGVAVGMSASQFLHLLSGIILVLWETKGGWRPLCRTLLGTAPIAVGPVLLGLAGHVALVALGAPWFVAFTLTCAIVILSWLTTIMLIPVQTLGEHGPWLLQSLSKFVPSRLPKSAILRAWIARSPTAEMQGQS
ncbi:oligosaccharide flippase family protein [Parvibaculum sedimenti]|uniref:Oligosaccharide flippase family protein n=1 Tax=Parvibaculum sedimenti TaxID=2608632 RepID=A0A6N6VMW8_9HYPH|nr:oligosaccharide flippase family protein [Parvibaculum sedimenti]